MLPRGSSNRGARGARGARLSDGGPTRSRGRGRGSSKTVRFASPLEQSNSNVVSSPSIVSDSLSLKHSTTPFGVSGATIQSTKVPPNPFAGPSNPFSTSTSKSTISHDQFARQHRTNATQTNQFGTPAMEVHTLSAFNAPSGLNGVFKPSSLRNSFTAQNTVVSGSSSPSTTSPSDVNSLIYTSSTPSTNAALAINSTLRQQGIIAPSWPETREKSAMEAFWKAMKGYRVKARSALIRAGLLDDPDKPKKLSEAIDFRGTCEGMCPEFEQINRIIEHDVQGPEKEQTVKYGYGPSPSIMVKALARSAAGQDAPLPEDIRSPAALRRTLDYLIDSLLERNDLPEIHGFLWDRTRAIRRDFVFQQSSMNSQELLDQVYCLENITRFHAIALHQMSRNDVLADDFSEQQEVEQLGKALLSLIHAYEDCNAQSVVCENEKEFRAYYTLFNSYNTGILEAVQDWGWKYWGESDEIRTAVNLVESLQNIWDTHGPLKPPSATDIAQNAYYRFFSLVRDKKVSYTMACFAEIHFNKVRKAALKTILAGYRKQRDQTKDWTLERLNIYLCFDDEQEIIAFGEAHGLRFETTDGETCLSFESEDSITDPFPQLKQYHSKLLVERKRGELNLPAVIHQTVFEELTCDEGMFVPESPSTAGFGQSSRSFSSVLPPQTLGNESSSSTSKVGLPSKEDRSASQSTNQFSARPFSFLSQQSAPTLKEAKLTTPESPQQSITGPMNGIREVPSVLATGPQSLIKTPFSFLKPGDIAPIPAIQNNNSPLTLKPGGESAENLSVLSNSLTRNPLPQVKSSNQISVFKSDTHLPVSDLTSVGASNQLSSADSPKLHGLEPIESPFQGDASEGSSWVAGFGTINNKNNPESRDSTIKQPVDKKNEMLKVSSWLALGEEGLIDKFVEVTVQHLLSDIFAKHHAEETKIRLEHEERLASVQATRFRNRTLARKYGYRWRLITRRLWLRRRGREAREARRRMAEDKFRDSKATQNSSLIDGFRSSGNSKARKALGQMLLDTGVLDGVCQVNDKIRNIVEGKDSQSHMSSLIPQTSDNCENGTHQKISDPHSHPPNTHSQNILLDSSYLQGGSRIHLIPNYSSDVEGRRQSNGVQTDYFRLKARGIMTLPDGTPLANSAALHLPRQSQFLNGRSKGTTAERPTNKSTPRSVPERLAVSEMGHLNEDRWMVDDLEALKARARTIMAEDDETRLSKKRLFDEGDEELFAKAKKIREQMDEGAEWFRIEAQKSISRSVS